MLSSPPLCHLAARIQSELEKDRSWSDSHTRDLILSTNMVHESNLLVLLPRGTKWCPPTQPHNHSDHQKRQDDSSQHDWCTAERSCLADTETTCSESEQSMQYAVVGVAHNTRLRKFYVGVQMKFWDLVWLITWLIERTLT